MNMTIAELDTMWAEYDEACEEVARECAEEGYPSHGSNYELRVARLKEVFSELFYEEEDET